MTNPTKSITEGLKQVKENRTLHHEAMVLVDRFFQGIASDLLDPDYPTDPMDALDSVLGAMEIDGNHDDIVEYVRSLSHQDMMRFAKEVLGGYEGMENN